MKQHKQHTPQALRFRRWSRAAYAVFASLSAVVSIGFLAVSVSEKSSLSNENHATTPLKASLAFNENAEEESKEEFLLTLEENITISLNSDEAAACSDIFYIINPTD